MLYAILVPVMQFKKREKRPWSSITFGKVACFSVRLKVTLLHGCFSRFLNCTNGTKSHKVSHIREIMILVNYVELLP